MNINKNNSSDSSNKTNNCSSNYPNSNANTNSASTSFNMKTPNTVPTGTQPNKSNLDSSLSSITDDGSLSETFSILMKDSVQSTSTEFFNQHRISPENFSAFCDQLHSFVQCIKNVQDITKLTYNLPSRLQEILDEEAKELDCLYSEVRDANINIERIKAQRKAIRKEKYTAEKLLKKMKDEETKEMETVISVYDRSMFARWEVIKNSRKIEAVENFLYDIEGKLLAMKHLKILATQKINKVITWTLKESTEKRIRKEPKKTSMDKESGPRKDNSITTEQEPKRRKTRQPRLSKTELPRTEATNTSVIPSMRGQIDLAAEFILDDSLTDRSHESIRTVELNSEMQTVLRTLFGGPPRSDSSTQSAQIANTNTTAPSNSTTEANDNREIHIYLSHSYQN